MANLISERVKLAREGQNPFVICRVPSGWLVIGDVQPLPGYCLLLSDPVVDSINTLNDVQRSIYARDMLVIGDALLASTRAYRINYETWGNSEPDLHTHIVPRYMDELEEKRRKPACMGYDWPTSPAFDKDRDGPFVARMRSFLKAT